MKDWFEGWRFHLSFWWVGFGMRWEALCHRISGKHRFSGLMTVNGDEAFMSCSCGKRRELDVPKEPGIVAFDGNKVTFIPFSGPPTTLEG